MFDTLTSKARPTAASHAANTRMVIGIGIDAIEFEFREATEVIINNDSIIPSRHRRVDIKWDRNMSVPKSENVKASVRLVKVDDIIGNYEHNHSLMSRNHLFCLN